MRRNDCSQVTDGGAGVVLVVGRAGCAAHPGGSPTPCARIVGWGHRTVGLPLAAKLERCGRRPYVLPHVRDTITDAFGRAGHRVVSGSTASRPTTASRRRSTWRSTTSASPRPGECWKAIEAGGHRAGRPHPGEPGGGLIGGGHPVGATGVRMVVDATRQVTGTAGDTQVDGARTVATLNIGGTTATTVLVRRRRGAPA